MARPYAQNGRAKCLRGGLSRYCDGDGAREGYATTSLAGLRVIRASLEALLLGRPDLSQLEVMAHFGDGVGEMTIPVFTPRAPEAYEQVYVIQDQRRYLLD